MKYLLEGVEKGEANAMNNLGVFYLNRGDETNAIKYMIMGAENGYRMGYWNLMLHYANVGNNKLFSKYLFYISILSNNILLDF